MFTKVLLLLAVVAGIVFFFKIKDKKSIEKQSDELVNAVEMKQDSVCGSFVEDTTKYKVKLNNKIYYFCSEECKNKFIEEHTK